MKYLSKHELGQTIYISRKKK